jgi:ABC-2 type transport system permease protein
VLAGLNIFWGVPILFSRILIFLVTIVLAVTLNFLLFYSISAISFWIVEVGFLFEGIRIVIVLLSGGIFPLEVFGERFLQVVNLLPFKYTVSFPINVLNGKIDPAGIGVGILVQVLWIVVFLGVSNLLWRVGSRRFVAVGG